MKILYRSKDKKTAFAIAGSENPAMSFKEMRYTQEQVEPYLTTDEEKRIFAYEMEFGNYGSMPQFTSLYALCSEDRPMVMFAAEGGHCDTCLSIFLKYGEGRRPDFDKLEDLRTCIDNYDGDIGKAAVKAEALVNVMFPERLYVFSHALGVMSDLWDNFTWDRYQRHEHLPYASPWTHVHMSVKGEMLWSLLASQPAEAYSEERVASYRKRIKEGERFGCIIYAIPRISNYAIILDGHHRVLASMLEGVFPDCLLIRRASYRFGTRDNQTVLNVHPSWKISRQNLGISGLSEEMLKRLGKYESSFYEVDPQGEDKYYAYYPRGRIVFKIKEDRYILYADKCIGPKALEDIKKAFGIEGENVTLASDLHYVCKNCNIEYYE